MERNEIFRNVNRLIKSVMSDNLIDTIETIREDTMVLYNGLRLSSLDIVILIVKIEEFFNFQWPDELLMFDYEFTVGEIVDIIEKQIN